jgi:hypothetical protein
LLSQIAWLNRQLFGCRSEKWACLDPNQPSLFEDITVPRQTAEEIESARQAAVEQIEVSTVDRKKERHQRKLLENLPLTSTMRHPTVISRCFCRIIFRLTCVFESGSLF